MARGTIVKRPGGQYAIRYYGPDKRRRYETIGRNKEDAERALTARLREIDAGTWRPPSSETLTSYAERWLDRRNPARASSARTRLAPSTFESYRLNLRRHVLPRLGSRALAELRTDDVDEVIAKLEAEGLAAGTVRNVIVPLRKLLGDAVRQGLLASNPAARADLPPAQDFGGAEIPLEHTEAIREALVALAPQDPLGDGPDLFAAHFFDVALGTGLRLGELRALRWRDVDRDRRLIRVERAFSRRELRRPKTSAGIRSVPLFASVDAALRALAVRSLERDRYAPDELIFSTPRGTPLHPENIRRRVWAPALQRAELGEWRTDVRGRRNWIGRYRLHDLRHTCVSRLVAAGADVKLVQTVAGHANPLITLKRYSHLLDSRVTEAADRFDPAAAPR